MKNRKLTTLALLLATAALSACGPTSASLDEQQSYSMDGVKYLSPSITDGASPATYLQNEYSISDNGRLLMRFEDLASKRDYVSTASGNKVVVLVTLVAGEDPAAGVASLRICPVTKNWMMLATWNRAFPMPGGTWAQGGGDFDAGGCLAGTDRDPAAARHTLEFDATSWFVDYVRGRSMNFGLLLISHDGAATRVIGDANGQYSPRIEWKSVWSSTAAVQ